MGLEVMGCLLSVCQCRRPWIPQLWEVEEKRRGGGGEKRGSRKDYKGGRREGGERTEGEKTGAESIAL